MEFSTLNGYKVKDKKAIRSYDTLALMQSDTKLKEGQRVKTKGYYTANDGGHGEYEIVNQTLTSDGGSIIELSNGLYAKLIVENGIINAKQYGIENNETCTEKLQTMVNLYNNIKIEDLILNIDDTISLHSDLKIDIVNSTINQLSVSNKKYIFYLNNCNNVLINGNKSILIGQKPTEVTQQAGISIENGCRNIIIQGLTLSSFGGDGLTLGGTENNISNNLSIKNCVITNNLRNGISLIGGLDGVYIENCDINLSSGANPQTGIDIETWKNTLFNNNIFIYKNKFSENVSGGLKIFENSKNIFIENNIFCTDNKL